MSHLQIMNNYWMTISMVSGIIQTEVNFICRSRRLRWITLTEFWLIFYIMCKPNPIIVLLYIQDSHTKMQAKCNNKKSHAINLAKFCYFVIFPSFEVVTSSVSNNSQYSTEITPQLPDIDNHETRI